MGRERKRDGERKREGMNEIDSERERRLTKKRARDK
jgi:hypothetical protein